MPTHSNAEVSTTVPITGRRRMVSRIGVFLAIICVTVLTLVGVFFGARELWFSEVDERARVDVSKQLEDFLAFAESENDPNTADSFGSSTRLLDVYLSTQVPGPDESFAGIVDGRIIQMDRGETAPRLEPGTLEIEEIAATDQATGVIADDDGTALHWGKVHVTSPEDSRPAVFVVARYTDADHVQVTASLEQLQLLGLISAGAAVPVAFILALWLGRNRRVPATTPPPEQETTADHEPAGRPHGDPTYNYRRSLALTGRQLDEQITYLWPRAKQDPMLVPHLTQLRRLSDSLTALTAVLDPESSDEHLRIDSGELTWQLVQRIRHDSAQPVRLSSTATGHQIDVNPEHLRLALSEALYIASATADTEEKMLEFGTAFRGEEQSRVLSLWIRHRGKTNHPVSAGISGSAPPVMQAVAQLHGGRAWIQEGGTLGIMAGIDIPVSATEAD